jgi:hypothetical protein
MKISSLIKTIPRSALIKSLIIGTSLVVFLLLIITRFNFQGDLEGLYLLRGAKSGSFELRDDVYLGEAERVIAKIEFRWIHDLLGTDNSSPNASHLRFKWNASGGHGYIHNKNADGSEFVICLSRFLDSSGKIPRGLFIGGELPQPIYGNDGVRLNETGMAYKQGGRWYHIWCNANEGIANTRTPDKMIYPSEWEFLGSKVLFSSKKEIVLKSSHQTSLDGVPTRIDRFLFHNADNKYVILAIRIKNIGDKPCGFFYVYGDEPWLGDYGTSAGNVGWTEGKLYHYTGVVDPMAQSTAGIADLGNPLSPYEQGRNFSGLANFISWIGMIRPSLVYFANKEGDPHDESEKVPFDSPNNRVIFGQWGPTKLAPQESATIMLAIGMADRNPKTGLPTQPKIKLKWDDMNHLMNDAQ